MEKSVLVEHQKWRLYNFYSQSNWGDWQAAATKNNHLILTDWSPTQETFLKGISIFVLILLKLGLIKEIYKTGKSKWLWFYLDGGGICNNHCHIMACGKLKSEVICKSWVP